jgi:hypothetical protein
MLRAVFMAALFFLVLLPETRLMKPLLLPTAYLPPVSWMAVALKYQEVSIELHETYPKQTFRNRCNIATANGILNLSIPVIKVNGNHTPTCAILIDNSKNWQQLHWRSIITAYNKSPYFLYYRDVIETLYRKKHENLVTLNQEFLITLLATLNIRTFKIHNTEDYIFEPEGINLRNSFSPKQQPYQNITKALPRYMQVFEEIHGFIPDLSVIDLLFNLGPDASTYLSNVEIAIPSGY